MGVVLAVLMLLGIVSLAAAAILHITSDASEPVAMEPETRRETAGASERPLEPDAVEAGAVETEGQPLGATQKRAANLNEIAWTTDAPSTLEELSRAWSIPRDVLSNLNPDLSAQRLKTGTKVIVHSQTLGAGLSVGAPNDGRLTRGVPLPEGDAWALPADRTRAFATAETIAALTAGLEAYGRRFPNAEPIQLGDLSARRGGKILGHQSHQTGRDVDIRLIRDSTGDGFDAERNWFLVKTLIDDSDVRAIFLNATEQTWLRSAAEADVGVGPAAQYFARIDHEPGHTIHMHVRFACPKAHRRCVGYSQPDAAEQDPTRKLPRGPRGTPNRKKAKRPTLRPKRPARAPRTTKPRRRGR